MDIDHSGRSNVHGHHAGRPGAGRGGASAYAAGCATSTWLRAARGESSSRCFPHRNRRCADAGGARPVRVIADESPPTERQRFPSPSASASPAARRDDEGRRCLVATRGSCPFTAPLKDETGSSGLVHLAVDARLKQGRAKRRARRWQRRMPRSGSGQGDPGRIGARQHLGAQLPQQEGAEHDPERPCRRARTIFTLRPQCDPSRCVRSSPARSGPSRPKREYMAVSARPSTAGASASTALEAASGQRSPHSQGS